MDEPHYTFRDYRNTDYARCESLVSNAWEFDRNFSPQGLANVAKRLYTMSSFLNSNYFRVVETEGEMAGFLFGLNEKSTLPRKLPLIAFGLGILARLLLLRGVRFEEKKRLLNAINSHSANRLKLVSPGRSEITLFVIDPQHQGAGNGKHLLSEFIAHCKASGEKTIVVETNTEGASTFYESMDFTLIGYFDSPLHQYAAKAGRACMYEYHCE